MMPRLLSPLYSAIVALAVMAAAPVAEAQNCSTNPEDVTGNWEVADGTRLCSGTYDVASMSLRNNRTLFLGGDNDEGQVIIRVAGSASFLGKVEGTGGGFEGGRGCTSSLFNDGSGRAGRDGAGPGPGTGAPAYSTRNGGGSGGGGAGHGSAGGAGGGGSGGGTGGAAGGLYGSATDGLAVSGSGGGGGSCSRGGFWGAGVNGGRRGGAGGASISIQAKTLFLSADAIVRVNGAAGEGSNNAGGPGGGGSAGAIVLRATEQLRVNGQLEARGGQGGNGGSNNNGTSGGAGGGAGGRIQVYGPDTCAAYEMIVEGGVAGTAGAQAAAAGADGGLGTTHCANIQVPPVASLTASPAVVAEGGTSTLTATATDANGHLLKYEFDCGDGNWTPISTSTTTTSCMYTTVGTYAARVRVTDWNSVALTSGTTISPPGTVSFGGSTIVTTPVTVSNGPPVIELGVDRNPVDEGGTASFTVKIADSAADMAAGFDVAWDFGDGSPVVNDTAVQSPATATHTYEESGSWTVTVRVTDQNGGEANASLTMDVTNLAPVVAFTSVPSPIEAGEEVSFGVTTTDPSPGDTSAGFTYSFTWGDDTSLTDDGPANFSVDKTFSEAGVFNVSVTATDRDGATSEPAVVIVTVVPSSGPLPPGDFVFVTEPGGATIDEGGSLKITATWRDPDPVNHSHPFSFRWKFGDNTPDVEGVTVPGSVICSSFLCTATTSIDHVYEESGNRTLELSVTNSTGQTGSASLPIKVLNVAPVGSILGAPRGEEGSPVNFRFSAVDVSVEDTAAGFTWVVSWGDGSPSDTLTGMSPIGATHTYDDNGDYEVTLTVTDKDGGVSAPVVATVPISNVAPSVVLTAPTEGEEGSALTFSATATDPSTADTNHGFTYEWDFDDGSTPVSGINLDSVEHTFVDDGTYTVSVTVTDKDGGETTEQSTVVISNVAPTVFLGSDLELRRGETFSIAASATDPGSNDTLTYEWTLGDGTTASGESISHSYAEFGEYTITVVVTDGDGGEATDSIVARVRNEPPVASDVVIEPAEPVPGEALTLTWTYTDDDGDAEDGTTVRWTIDGEPAPRFDDLTEIEGTATMRGQVWRATVTPKDGADFGLPVQSQPVTIANEAPVVTDVVITPADPRAEDELEVSYTYFDPDGDSESGTRIRWTRNGAAVSSLDGARTVTMSLVKGDIWLVTVTPNDGSMEGEPVASEPVTVLNTPPTVARIEDIAVPAQGQTTPVSFDIDAFDVDGDVLAYSCELDGVQVGVDSHVELSLTEGIHEIFCTVDDGTDAVVESLSVAVGDVGPLVDAGADRTVNPDRITLEAIGRDALDRPLSYVWTVLKSPVETNLDTPALASTAVIVRKAGVYIFGVSVSNGISEATDSVTIEVRNIAPVADAGPATRTARAEETVTLDARASTDANGDELTFLWEYVSGPEVEFEGEPTDALVLVVAEDSGELIMRLTVSDGTLSSSTTVSIRVAPEDDDADNHAPVAITGPDQTAIVGETVTLDGSASYDLDGDELTYEWTQRSGPPLELDTPEAVETTLVAAVPGTYAFVLTVFDGVLFAHDTVTVEIFDDAGNTRPVAVITPDEAETDTVDRVLFDGSESFASDGAPLTFRWTQVSGPTANIIETTTPTVLVNSMSAGVVVISLVVNDGRLDSRPVFATVRVSDGNEAPVAVAKGPSVGKIGVAYTLDGSESYDPEGELLTYRWAQVEGPSAELLRPETVNPTFTAEADGTYVFELIVNDGRNDSEPDTIEIKIGSGTDATLVAVIEGPTEAFVNEEVYLTGHNSSDPDGEGLTFAWSIIAGEEGVSLLNADTTQPTFIATTPGTYEVALVVSDGDSDSDQVVHTIVVHPLPALAGGCDCGAGAGLSGLALLGLAALLRRRRKA